MAEFQATRPQSCVSVLTMVGCGNSFDVSSVVPNLTTVASCTWPSAATSPALLWEGWQAPTYQADSYFQIGVRIAVQGLSDDYWHMSYSVDSGQNWTFFTTSQGNVGFTSFVASVARTNTPTFFQVILGTEKTKGADTAYLQVSDVWAIGSGTPAAGTDYKVYPADNEGVTDYPFRVLDAVRAPGDNVGLTDDAQRVHDSSRTSGDNEGVTDDAQRALTMNRIIHS